MTTTESETKNLLFRSVYDWWLCFAFAGLLPMLVDQAKFLSQRPHFQFFPIAVLAFLFLAYTQAKLEVPRSQVRVNVAKALFGLSLFASVVAAVFFSPWLAYAAMALTCFAWLLMRYGVHPWTQLLSWCTLLLITLPPPRNLDERLIQKLQQISTLAASRLLDVVGVPHGLAANIIETRSEQLFVDQACSGIDSLYSLAAIALLLVVYQRKSLLVAGLTLLSVPGWAIVGNLVRIFLIVYLIDTFDVNLSSGWSHTALGLCLFALCSVGLLSTVSVLCDLCSPFVVGSATSGVFHGMFDALVTWPAIRASNRLKEVPHDSKRETPVTTPRFNPWPVTGLALQFAIMLAVAIASANQLLSRTSELGSEQLPGIDSIARATVDTQMVEDLMPATWMGMQRVGFQTQHREVSSVYGEHSAIWTYKDGSQLVQLSADFPFLGDHPLQLCYELIGNKVQKPIPISSVMAFNQEKTLLLQELHLTDEIREQSFVCFTICQRNGNSPSISSPPQSLFARGLLATKQALTPSETTLQFQVFAEGCGPLNEDQIARYRSLLVDATERLFGKVSQTVWPNSAN